MRGHIKFNSFEINRIIVPFEFVQILKIIVQTMKLRLRQKLNRSNLRKSTPVRRPDDETFRVEHPHEREGFWGMLPSRTKGGCCKCYAGQETG